MGQDWLLKIMQMLLGGQAPQSGGMPTQGSQIDQSPGQGQQMPGANLPGPFGGVRGGWGMGGQPMMGGQGGSVQPPGGMPPVGMGGPMMDKPNAGTDNLGQSPYSGFDRQLPRWRG